jgi:hypothetical protein
VPEWDEVQASQATHLATRDGAHLLACAGRRRAKVTRVLVLSLTDLAIDPRVNRQIRALSDRYQVIAAGTAPPKIDGIQFFPIPHPASRSFSRKAQSAVRLKLRQYEQYYWSQPQVHWCLSELADTRASVIIANDIITLPLALKLNSESGVILDAHEYAPRELEDRFTWRVFFQDYIDYLCRTYISKTRGMLTVCQSIADAYRTNYGISPEVVMNAPPYHDLQPRQTNGELIRLIHHGGAIPSRRIELMIETLELLDPRFYLDLMLVPTDARYLDRLRLIAGKNPRVRLVPPVPMRDLPRYLNQYDLGLYLLPPKNLNDQLALPNKFFEFVQGRLAIAIGPSPEMARLTRQYDLGVVADDFTPRSLAKKLNQLDPKRIDYYKQRSNQAAKELCFERNSEVLVNMINRLAGNG